MTTGLYYKELNKLRKKIPRHGFYYHVDMRLSCAYQTLTLSSRNLLYLMLIGCKYDWVRKEKHHRNNGKIGLPESRFKKYYNCSSQTYYNARDQLITVGFIEQTRQGGYGPRDYATYKLLCLPDVPVRHQRWRFYPEKNWKIKIPKRKNSSIGKATRFKKGVANRKLKTTLSE